MEKDLIQKSKLLGNYKTILGDGKTDIVLNALSNVFIRNGNTYKPIKDIYKSLEDLNKKDYGVIIVDDIKNIERKNGQLILDTSSNILYLIYDNNMVPIIKDIYKEDKEEDKKEDIESDNNNQEDDLNVDSNFLIFKKDLIIFKELKSENNKFQIKDKSVVINNININDLGLINITNNGLILNSNNLKFEITTNGDQRIFDKYGNNILNVDSIQNITDIGYETYSNILLTKNVSENTKFSNIVCNILPDKINFNDNTNLSTFGINGIEFIHNNSETELIIYKGITSDIKVGEQTLSFKNGILYKIQ